MEQPQVPRAMYDSLMHKPLYGHTFMSGSIVVACHPGHTICTLAAEIIVAGTCDAGLVESVREASRVFMQLGEIRAELSSLRASLALLEQVVADPNLMDSGCLVLDRCMERERELQAAIAKQSALWDSIKPAIDYLTPLEELPHTFIPNRQGYRFAGETPLHDQLDPAHYTVYDINEMFPATTVLELPLTSTRKFAEHVIIRLLPQPQVGGTTCYCGCLDREHRRRVSESIRSTTIAPDVRISITVGGDLQVRGETFGRLELYNYGCASTQDTFSLHFVGTIASLVHIPSDDTKWGAESKHRAMMPHRCDREYHHREDFILETCLPQRPICISRVIEEVEVPVEEEVAAEEEVARNRASKRQRC